MTAAGLLINTFFRLKGEDPGFRVDGVVVAELNSPATNWQTAKPVYGALLDRLRSMPGVEAAGLTSYAPTMHVTSILDFSIAGGAAGLRANSRIVSPGYFQTLRIPIVRGRDFDSHDRENSPRVVIVSESVARKYWPHEDPIGRLLTIQEGRTQSAAGIIGIARDVRQTDLKNEPDNMIYSAYTQGRGSSLTLVVRARGEAARQRPPQQSAHFFLNIDDDGGFTQFFGQALVLPAEFLHLLFLRANLTYIEKSLEVEGPEVREMIRDLVAHHVAITSTLAVFETLGSNRPPMERESAALKTLSPQAAKENLVGRSNVAESDIGGPMLGKEMRFERGFVAAGGLLTAGCDPSGYGGVVPGFGDQRNIELLVQAGFSSVEAIRIATLNGAIYMGRDASIGSVASGKAADLVVYRSCRGLYQPSDGAHNQEAKPADGK